MKEVIFEDERSVVFKKIKEFIKNLPDDKELIRSELKFIRNDPELGEIYKETLTIKDKEEK